MDYVELHCKTNFSFLEAASHPDELVEQAVLLGYRGLALTDRHSVAGIVRGWTPAKELGLPLITGAEFHPSDAPPLVLWAATRQGYGNLCRLISRGRMRAAKGACEIRLADIAERHEGLLAGVLPVREVDGGGMEAVGVSSSDALSDSCPLSPESVCAGSSPSPHAGPQTLLGERGQELREQRTAQTYREIFGDRTYLLAELHYGVDDSRYAEQLAQLSRQTRLPLVAAGDVYYHARHRMVLQDCLTAIRCGVTVAEIGPLRHANGERHLRTLEEIKRIYAALPGAIERTLEVASRCQFDLEQLRYEYPEELAPPGLSPLEHLRRLVWEGAQARYPGGVPEKILSMLRHEMELIRELNYEAYFLTVWDLVRFARSRNILCQGRGSAANSVVCYCLGITSIDPTEIDLLFERFISRERGEAPDIDVDFEHQRREEVLQYIYDKYGRHRCGMTATVTTYRIRSALRDVGKALGIDADRLDALAKISDSYKRATDLPERCQQVGLDPHSAIGQRFVYLVGTLIGFPRHLSQHVGGMVMTRGRLDEMCPIENAAMEERTVIQWDKDDLDALGILKVDCLALGMLSALHRCFDLVAQHHGRPLSLATIPANDKPTYDMICAADTVGVFQIESRAQMSMLPRLKPRCFYDLVVEVAIVRPGPIQGQMVHPYLQARQNPSAARYPNDAVRAVLEKTLGVPIFQEQAMRLAVVAAGFTPGEADQLRRAMAAWRRPGVIDRFRTKLMEGMRQNGLCEEFAEQVFRQIRSFGEYGFPESHAASFALLVYASSYLKCHFPAAFCAALLNSQPMGFYAPAQLVSDARRHGVEVRPADVNCSQWDCTLENDGRAIRLGLRMIRGLAESDAVRITAAAPYRDLADLAHRAAMSQPTIARLADADALTSVAPNRRAALWQAMAQDPKPRSMPLFDGDAAGETSDEPIPETLSAMTDLEEVYCDYATTGLSLKNHPMTFCREELDRRRVVTAERLAQTRNGRYVTVAGIVLLRQRPGTAKGVTFATIEDETGAINLVLFAKVWQRFYAIAQRSNAWLVHGKLENRENVIHVIVGRLEDLTTQVKGLDLRSRDFR